MPVVATPLLMVPIVGWLTAFVTFLVQSRLQGAVFPSAINLAYSDALGGPS